MAQQFNDPACRRADDPAHRCTDKHGAWWASPVRPARPGTTCWWETLRRLEDEREADAEALRRLADASTLDDLAGYGDVDFRESEEVR